MTVVVIDEGEFVIMEFAAPLDGLGDIATGGYCSIGGVSVVCADVAVLPVELADVFGQIPAVCVPCAVLLDGQRAGGYRLGGIPGDEPECRVVAAGEVTAGDLQESTVEVAMMESDGSVDRYFLGGAVAHIVVGAFDDRVRLRIGEAYGAVFGIVSYSPDTRGSLHECLVTGGIVGGSEITDSRVLVEVVGRVVGDFFRYFLCRVSVADVIVVVGISPIIHGGGSKLAAGVVAEGVVDGCTVSGGVSGNRAPRSIVGIGAACHAGVAALVGHAGEQVAYVPVAQSLTHDIMLYWLF